MKSTLQRLLFYANTVLCTGQFGDGKNRARCMCVTPLEGFYVSDLACA